MFEVKGDLSSVHIGDFGLSAQTELNFQLPLYSKCGTLLYMAPEMFQNRHYTKSVDVWSVGVILYRILAGGRFPFTKEELEVLFQQKDQNIDYIFKDLKCSDSCMNLLSRFLMVDPLKRYPAHLALCHPFLTEEDKAPPLMLYEVEKAFEVKTQIQTVILPLQAYEILDHETRPRQAQTNRDSASNSI
jgi:calcium/calmodulin-dependent protein kinase I